MEKCWWLSTRRWTNTGKTWLIRWSRFNSRNFKMKSKLWNMIRKSFNRRMQKKLRQRISSLRESKSWKRRWRCNRMKSKTWKTSSSNKRKTPMLLDLRRIVWFQASSHHRTTKWIDLEAQTESLPTPHNRMADRLIIHPLHSYHKTHPKQGMEDSDTTCPITNREWAQAEQEVRCLRDQTLVFLLANWVQSSTEIFRWSSWKIPSRTCTARR